MRVITGSARGRRLATLPGDDTRPTAERVKEAVFSIIQFSIEGRRILDLFAGSGQMGIEALSRGAQNAVFVDQNPAAVEVIRKNLTAVQFRQQSVVLQTDAQSFLLSNRDMYDIAFLDPPYGKDLIPQALEHLPARMSQAGIILCEHARSDQMPQQAEDFMIDRQYRYGRSMVTVYRRGGQEIE